MRGADGALLNLCEGLARSDSHALTVTVDLGNVCVALDPGTELVLMISGASYPRWEPLPEPRRQQLLAGSVLTVHTI